MDPQVAFQVGRQTDRQTDRLSDMKLNDSQTETNRLTDNYCVTDSDRQNHTQIDRLTDCLMDYRQ